MKIGNDLEQELTDIYIPLAAALKKKTESHDGPLVIGVNGAQGAGKSTLCRLLQIVLEQGFDQRVTSLSIDDLYLTYAERQKLAQQVHPLLATRGVPGTHDVELGLKLLSDLRELKAGQSLAIQRFDKAIDDRLRQEEWRQVTGPFDLILFEGWCVGALPQAEEALVEPINTLERDEDPELIWRRYVNQQLQESYLRLFAELDLLVMLKVPGLESVMKWRGIQEQKLASATEQQGHKIMNTAELQRFIMHYERLTRAMLQEMPGRAHIVLELNSKHQIDVVICNGLPSAGEV
jgi:D-glycerate 3-kinase